MDGHLQQNPKNLALHEYENDIITPMTEKRYRIVYEDEWLIIIDKPSGMLVIPTPKKETNTLTHLLNQELDRRGVEVNAYPCHRLDRETSGLIIYAKGKSAQKLMMEKFSAKEVAKKYTAFVHGDVRNGHGIINKPLYNRNKRESLNALTKYRVLERKADFTVVEVEPVTGRTNQIRIHFKDIGHPLVGESVYAFRKDFRLKFRRLGLHARELEFDHPVTGKRMRMESPLPHDMENFIKGERR